MARPLNKLFDLTGKVALVTGGSRGLGLQMATALGEAGAELILCSRKLADLQMVKGNLESKDIKCHVIAGDCSIEEDIQRIADEALQIGPVDILVNNAGATWGAAADVHPIPAWDKVMNVNIRGYFIMSQQIGAKSMIPRKTGKIINISSIAGLAGNPKNLNMIAYNTSKGAVVNFTRALAAEWGKYDINVNCLCPGFFPSKMTRATIRHIGSDTLCERAPLQRLGSDEDLKGISVLLASDAGRHITGQSIAVDGGVSIVVG